MNFSNLTEEPPIQRPHQDQWKASMVKPSLHPIAGLHTGDVQAQNDRP